LTFALYRHLFQRDSESLNRWFLYKMATDYNKKTIAELVEILKSRSLPHSGRKAELVSRIQKDDEDKAQAPGAKADATEDVIDWDDDAAGDETVKPSTEAGAAAIAAGGKGEVPNPVAVPNQELAIDPAKTDDLKVESTGDAPKAAAEAVTAASTEGEEKAAEKVVTSYAMGLPITELEEELKKRKARAEKFGVVEDSKEALDEAEKALQRAKRFGAETVSSDGGVKGLDQALPDERPRKRGRGDDQGGRGGKRRSFGGRNRNGRPNNRIRNGGNGGNAKPAWDEKDNSAMEARKKRFATAASS
jgi:SAP domain-containing ribonucleoprotein